MKYAISYDTVKEFIYDNNLKQNDAIVLHPDSYDALAAEYASENNVVIFRSFDILGVLILEDLSDDIKKNQIFVIPSRIGMAS